MSALTLALAVTTQAPAWSEEPSPPSDQGSVQERGIIPPAVNGLTPAEPRPGEPLRGATIVRGFRKYWIDRVDLNTAPKIGCLISPELPPFVQDPLLTVVVNTDGGVPELADHYVNNSRTF